jgi:hypothetical protein
MNSFADCRLIRLAILAFNFRFQISDKIANQPSKIENSLTEGAGFELANDCSRQFSRLLPYQLG